MQEKTIENTPRRVKRSTLLIVFLRCYLVGAAINTNGLQNIGLTFILSPAFANIYPDEKDCKKALERYSQYHHSSLSWTPLLAGIIISMEESVSRGEKPPLEVTRTKQTMERTLSSIGDTLGGHLKVFLSLFMACLMVTGRFAEIILLMAAILFFSQLFRVITFVLGYKEGLDVRIRLQRVRQKFIYYDEALDILNSLWLLLFYWIVIPVNISIYEWVIFVLSFVLIIISSQKPVYIKKKNIEWLPLPRDSIILLIILLGIIVIWTFF